MIERHELSIRSRTELNMMAGFGAVGGNRESLVAGRYQLDRPADPASGKRDKRSALAERAARTERPTHERRHDTDVIRGHAQLLGQAVLEAPDILAGFPYCEYAAVPRRDRTEQLDRVVVLG